MKTIVIPKYTRIPQTNEILEQGDIINIIESEEELTTLPEDTVIIELVADLLIESSSGEERMSILLDEKEKFYVAEKIAKVNRLPQLLRMDTLPPYFIYKAAMFRLTHSSDSTLADYYLLGNMPIIIYTIMPETIDAKVQKLIDRGDLAKKYQITFARKGMALVPVEVTSSVNTRQSTLPTGQKVTHALRPA